MKGMNGSYGTEKSRPVNINNPHPAVKSKDGHPEATYAGSNVHRSKAKMFGSRMKKKG